MQAASLALALVLGSGEPDAVLYDFGGPRCIYCQQMNPIVDRLIEEGHPIVKVNCDDRENAELVRRFQIQNLPTFVLVINGREVDRSVGGPAQTPERRLREMLAQIPEPEAEPERTALVAGSAQASSAAPPSSNHVRLGEPGPFPDATPSHPMLPAHDPPAADRNDLVVSPPSTPETPGVPRDRIGRADFEFVPPPQSSNDQLALGNNPEPNAGTPAASSITSMSASVRIRVLHSGRVNLGSGTIIVSRPGRSLIITCGHIFRDLGSDAKIEVDVFSGNAERTFVGTLTDFDIDAEIGLITIPTDEVLPTVAIVPANRAQQVQDRVASIGCSGGNAPSREQHRITAINKYEGPDNLECTGTPVEGRSGGGLFNSQEELIGVCFARGESEPLGLYAGPRAMYTMLDKYGLTALYTPQPPSQPAPPQLAETTPPTGSFDQNGSSGTPVPFVELGLPTNEPFAATQGYTTPDSGPAGADSLTTTSPPLDFDAGEAEVVCLIAEPDGSRRVVVLHRASPKFVAYLNGELDGAEALGSHDTATPRGVTTTAVTSQRMPRPSSTPVMSFAVSTPTPVARPYTMEGFQPTSLVQPMAPRAYVRQR